MNDNKAMLIFGFGFFFVIPILWVLLLSRFNVEIHKVFYLGVGGLVFTIFAWKVIDWQERKIKKKEACDEK